MLEAFFCHVKKEMEGTLSTEKLHVQVMVVKN